MVLDLTPQGATPEETAVATSAVVRGARELEAFQVMSSDDVRQVLALEQQRQVLGAESTQALSLLQSSLGARHVLVGTLTRTEAGYELELRLLDNSQGQVLAQRSSPPVAKLAQLIPEAPTLAQQTLGALLQDQLGFLLVRSSEEGSEVVVDDLLVASTPMVSPHRLPRGKHRLTVRKEGFIARSTTVRIEQEQVTVEEATLVPSRDFAQQHAAHHRKLRLGAWIATGVAVAALSSALVMDRYLTEPTYQKEFIPRRQVLEMESTAPAEFENATFETELAQGCAADTTACRQTAESLQRKLRDQQLIQWGLVGTGIVAAGVGSYFWLRGEDPSRYTHLMVSLGQDHGGLVWGTRF